MIDIVMNLLKNIGEWNIIGTVYSSPTVECFIIERRGGDGNKERSLFRTFKRGETVQELRHVLAQIEELVGDKEFKYILGYKEGFAAAVNGVSYLCVRMDNAQLISGIVRENQMIGMARNVCKAVDEWNKLTNYGIEITPESIYMDPRNQYRVDVLNEKFVNSFLNDQKASAIYSAPEVCNANNTSNTPVSQMYSIGLILYEMSNDGCLPFLTKKKEKCHFEEMKRAVNRRLDGERFDTPCYASEGVAKVIMRACSYDAKDRYTNLADFEYALGNSGYTNHELSGRRDKGGTRILGAQTTKKDVSEIPKKKLAVIAAVLALLLVCGGIFKLTNRKIQVPDVREMTYDEAKKVIQAAGLEMSDYNSELKENYLVLAQSPAAESSVKKKTKVTVEMYQVKKDVTIPELIGLNEEQAKTTLEQAGLLSEVEYQFSDTEKGLVLSSSPEVGNVVLEGDTVKLVVSQGKEQVEVPNLKGVKQDELDGLVKNIGLDYTISEVFDNSEVGTVVNQSIEAGTQVDKGTVLEIEVSKGEKKTEAPKTEEPKTEAPKTEAPKREEPKTEAPKTEAPKKEKPKKEKKPSKKESEDWDFE